MNVYLDYAAATPVSSDVLAAMQPYYTERFYNPSGLFQASRDVKHSLEEARSTVALLAGCRPAEVIFTAGGTEANNVALQGVARAFSDSHIVYSALEHESVRVPAQWLAEHGYGAREVKPDGKGLVHAEAVTEAIHDNTVLISIMLANNEIGTIQPLRKITQAVQKIREERIKSGNNLPLYIHTDACQAANYLDVHLNRLGVDMMTLNGGKMYGPKQSGALIARSHVRMEPLQFGGGQERGLRSGTENVAFAVGFAAALQDAQSRRSEESERLSVLRDAFLSKLEDMPGITVNGSRKHRLPNNIHFTADNHDNERLLYALDESGIMCATGSACNASKEEASHVLRVLGKSDQEARSSLRMTLGRSTTQEQLDYVYARLQDLLQT